MEVTILKLGGALITNKRKGVFDRARVRIIERIAEEIADSLSGRLIIIHGAGSFGHPYVEKYGMEELKRNIHGVSDTHLACERLCSIVCRALINSGVSPAPIHPFSAFRVERGRIIFDRRIFTRLIEEGFIPVTHGDVVSGDDGWRVLSGDDIAVELAVSFGARRVGFATNTQIVLNGRKVKEFSISSSSLTESRSSRVSDVTGGMQGKLKKVERIAGSSEVFIFSGLKRGSISAFLRGESVGTRILP